MCCINNKNSWDQFKLDHPNKDVFIPVYKRLKVIKNSFNEKVLVSPSQAYTWEPGIHVDVESPRQRQNARTGIHVYLKNEDMGYKGGGRKTVKLYALVSSIIAVDNNHAVFGTVLLTQKEYDKATR